MASSDSAVRTMPHNTLAEETVLSAILTDPENTIDRCVEKLTPAHFYVRGNRMIYETCLAMREKAEVVETNSVVSRLKDAGHLEEVGGIFRVNQIATAFVTSANVDYYLGLLQEKHQLRRVIESSTRFIQMAYERQDSVEQFKAAGRNDLADKEQREIELFRAYQPRQLGAAEIEALVRNVIAETGAAGKKDLGKVMQALMPQVKGKSDGKLVNQIVMAQLGG